MKVMIMKPIDCYWFEIDCGGPFCSRNCDAEKFEKCWVLEQNKDPRECVDFGLGEAIRIRMQHEQERSKKNSTGS